MKDRPLLVRQIEGQDVVLLGSVHTLYANVPPILREIDRRSPCFVAVELTDAGRLTGSLDIDAVSRKYRGRLLCLDRRPDVTASRYLCDTRPFRFLAETLQRYAWLPLNQASILAFNYVPGLYRRLLGHHFYSFGWSREDRKRFIFERDEYMAAQLIAHMRSRRASGCHDAYVVVAGRRHVDGMSALLDAYAATGDAGSYYAGGRVTDVFSLATLEEPYTAGPEEATRNLRMNRIIESLARTLCWPAYLLALFLVIVAVLVVINTAAAALA